MLPRGWKERLVRVANENTRQAVGLCLEVHDLLISKYVAGREKDRRFARAAIAHGLVDRGTLLERLAETPIDQATRERLSALIAHDFARAQSAGA